MGKLPARVGNEIKNYQGQQPQHEARRQKKNEKNGQENATNRKKESQAQRELSRRTNWTGPGM